MYIETKLNRGFQIHLSTATTGRKPWLSKKMSREQSRHSEIHEMRKSEMSSRVSEHAHTQTHLQLSFSSRLPRDVTLSAVMNSSNSTVPSLFTSNVVKTNFANFSELPWLCVEEGEVVNRSVPLWRQKSRQLIFVTNFFKLF